MNKKKSPEVIPQGQELRLTDSLINSVANNVTNHLNNVGYYYRNIVYSDSFNDILRYFEDYYFHIPVYDLFRDTMLFSNDFKPTDWLLREGWVVKEIDEIDNDGLPNSVRYEFTEGGILFLHRVLSAFIQLHNLYAPFVPHPIK